MTDMPWCNCTCVGSAAKCVLLLFCCLLPGAPPSFTPGPSSLVPAPGLSNVATPPAIDERALPPTTLSDQFPFTVPLSGASNSSSTSIASSLHPQIFKMLGLPLEQPKDVSSGSVSETGVWVCGCGCGRSTHVLCHCVLFSLLPAPPSGAVDQPTTSQQQPRTVPAQHLSKLKLSPVRQQRTTKLLLPKPAASNPWVWGGRGTERGGRGRGVV